MKGTGIVSTIQQAVKSFILMKCPDNEVYIVGVLYEQQGSWVLKYSAIASPSVVISPTDKRMISGTFGVSPEYAGCPACKATGYVKCSSCQQLSCWADVESTFTCGWCGTTGTVDGLITSIGVNHD
jgi:hypothetical protein